MSLLYIEGFDEWNSDNSGTGWYGSMTTGSPGRFGDGRYAESAGQSSTLTFTPASTVIIGMGLKWDTQGHAFRLQIGSALCVHGDRNGLNTITIRQGDINGTILDTSNVNVIFPTVWNYVEVKVTVSATTGTCAVRVNGVPVPGLADLTNINTGSTNIGTFRIYQDEAFGNDNLKIDDVYVCDGNGSKNNDFLGDVRVETLYPTGAGNTTQWTPVSATYNWQAVDELPSDSDTTYVTASGVGAKDLYTMSDLNTLVGTVFGVQASIRARKTDSGTRAIEGVFRTGASEANTTSFGAIAATYMYFREIREDKPGGTGWTISEVNSMELGVELSE